MKEAAHDRHEASKIIFVTWKQETRKSGR